jgi:SdpI/YfhL protein family
VLTKTTIAGEITGRAAGILTSVRTSALLGVMQLLAGAGLLTVGLLGWRRRLPRNRFAGIRTPATLRSEAAFSAANHVAAPPVLAAGAVCLASGALSLGMDGGPVLAVIVGIAGAGTIGLLLAGGLLGHRLAAAMPPPGCRECTCRGGSCAVDMTRLPRA